VLSVEGSATTSAENGDKPLPFLTGAHFGRNALIQTLASSRVAIAFLPSILVQLDHDTRLEIMRISLTKDGNETGEAMRGRSAAVRLLAGRMFVSHTWGQANAAFTIATAQGDLFTGSNSLFCVESSQGKTRVTCVSGTVGFRPHEGGAEMRIPPGFFGEWSSQASSIAAAETDARGQEDLQEALEVERRLRGLLGKTR
jgi:hypothetical protein